MSFAGAARRLAGMSAVLLGWRPGEFWAATPAELAVIFDAMAGRGDGDGAGAPDADVLARLKEMFPDG